MTREEAIKILRREIECLSHTKCEDCILEVTCDPIKTTPYDSEYIEAYKMAISALSENKGEWKRISPARIYECSCCGQNVMTSDIECYKFCHGCGVKMEGVKE